MSLLQGQNSEFCYGIVTSDTIKYIRDNGNEKSITKNSVTRILAYKKDSNRYLCEFIVKDINSADEANSEYDYRDKVMLKENQLQILYSEKSPDKYMCKILDSFYKKGTINNKINSWNYDESFKLLTVSYTSVEDNETYSSETQYRIVNDEPVLFKHTPVTK